MKFLIMGYDDPIEFGHGDNTQLVIEDTKLYTHIVQLLNAIINEKYKTNEIEILEDKSDKDILSKAILIINPFQLDLNAKPIIKALYEEVSKILIDDGDQFLQYKEYITDINKIVLDIIEEFNVDFSFDDDLPLEGYLKAINLKITKDPEEPMFDTFLNYIELISELTPKTPLIICNCLSYFTKHEIEELCKYMNYKCMNVLFVENHCNELIPDCHQYIIDDDLCMI